MRRTRSIRPIRGRISARRAGRRRSTSPAAGLKRIRDAHGPKALAGFGSAKGSNEEAYLFQKLVRTGFGSNNVDHCTRLCHASSVAALMEGLNSGAVTAPFSAALDAEVIIVIGANPTDQPSGRRDLHQERREGARRQADRHGSARPAALAPRALPPRLQARHRRGDAERHAPHDRRGEADDEQYIAGYTEGFEELKEKIRDFPPEKMEAVCGIPAETIREVARLYARSRASIIFWGMGISQHVHGTDNARCLIALALTTGQIGRPGTGPASAARPEQRAGRLRRRADPDGLSGLPVGREAAGPASCSRSSGARRSIRSAA